MKKTTAFLLSVMLVMSAAYFAYGMEYMEYGREYTDVKSGNWAHEAISTISDKAIIKGYPDGTFKPDSTVTYGEFIKMALIATTGEDPGNAESGNWAANYYESALENEYFTKYDIDKSQLNSHIPRSDMALIISSILGDIKINNYDKIQEGIKDITYKTKNEYHITKAYATGILTGYTDNTFRPEKTLTRAESAMVIYRLIDESKRELPLGEEKEQDKYVKEVIKNIDSFVNPGNGTINEDLAAAASYEIVTDASIYGMSLHENRGTKWIDIKHSRGEAYLGQMYLMKDGEIVEFMQLIPDVDGSRAAAYKSNIAEMDYIVSLHVSQNHIKLIENPFKK